ncbi:MAG: phage portal protein [Proteobacteria bacterium]|nr:phage portal protein [Pseudomonadota bacterium]
MWLDDLIGVFSPVSGLKRKQARVALDIMQRGYEGAKTGRRIDDWLTTGASANKEIASAGNRLRERARDLVRNNPYGSKAVEVFVGNAIGTGIIPQASTGSDRLNKQIMAAWEEWETACDAEGDLDFYGIQSMAARAIFESGECFVRFRDRPYSQEFRVPFQLQVLEADFLDTTKNMPAGSGNYINQGVEFDKYNRRVAYWMWPQHPGENAIGAMRLQSVRIPADQIVHLFRKQRPGQFRGVTAFAPSIVRMRDLDGYDDAELWRKKIEACFAAFVTQVNGSDGPIVGNVVKQTASSGASGSSNDPDKLEQFRPGMIEYLQPGEDIRFGNPNSDGNYESYERVQLHAIAAGLGITYEQLTGDLSQVNYSSLRAGLLEFRRLVEMLRWQVFVPKLCVPVWRKFIERAYVAGEISKIDYGVSWTPQKFEMIDPLKDAQADTLMIRNGTLTLKEAIARQGYDPEKQIEEIAATNKLLDDKEIILDCDPRYTAKSGIQQTDKGGSNADTTPVKQSTKKSKQLELPIDGEGESSPANEDGDA